MWKNILFAFVLLAWGNDALTQNSCAAPINIADGNCITFSIVINNGSIVTACNGGNHPLAFMRYTAPANGDCVQFTFNGATTGGTFQFATYTVGCASYVTNSAQCIENVVAGQPFTYSSKSAAGINLVNPGQTYIVAIQSNTPCSLTACMQTPSVYSPSDECNGAQQIGTSSVSLNNLGDCNYSGTLDNSTASDPNSIQLCAGSLENTQWSSFIANASSIQIVGSGISCTGGGCGFQFGIFTGVCGALTNIGCYGNKVCTGGQSIAGPTNPAGMLAWTGTSSTGFTATISGLTVGETVYLAMDGNADADCQYVLAGINVLALPVELTNFEGIQKENDVELHWETASETENAYFSVERSEDNHQFVEIAKVVGGFNSSEQLAYDYLDENLTGLYYYYRLCQVDLDGEKTFSKTIGVFMNPWQPKVVHRYNMLGAEIDAANHHGMMIEVYDDGSVKKIWKD